MKTYLFDTINRYKRFSEKLDAQTIFTKAWRVFCDTGEKSLYIFQADGSLIISVNGFVHMGSWQYIAANQSVMIKNSEQIYLFQPAFYDENILTLRLDDTNNCVFLIDDSNPNFKPKNWDELTSYFKEKERIFIEQEKKEKSKESQDKAETTEILEVEELTSEQIAAKKRANTIRDDIEMLQICKSIFPIFIFIFLVIMALVYINIDFSELGTIILVCGIALLINVVFQMSDIDSKIQKWKEEHPDDPACDFL